MAKFFDLQPYVAIATTSLLWILMIGIREVSGLGCYVCSSVNGSNAKCEDTFNSTDEYYKAQCKAGRKGRSGLFPGTECIKMKAEQASGSDPYMILVRDCVVDNGDINSETEIGRIDHCGLVDWIKFDDKNYRGCVLTCNTDGCNSAPPAHLSFPPVIHLAFMLSVYLCITLL